MEDNLRTYFSRLRSTPHLRTHAHHAPSRIPSCSMFNVPYVPFPSLHSSSSASPSRSIATIPMRTRSRCPTSTSAPATWSEPGRLTDSYSRTDFAKFADLFAYTNQIHSPIEIPSDHPRFLCSKNLTVIPPPLTVCRTPMHPAAAKLPQLAVFQCSVLTSARKLYV